MFRQWKATCGHSFDKPVKSEIKHAFYFCVFYDTSCQGYKAKQYECRQLSLRSKKRSSVKPTISTCKLSFLNFEALEMQSIHLT